MNNVEYFNNLREIQKQATAGVSVENVGFGKKRILFESVKESQSAINCADLLNACIRSGILKADIQLGTNSVRHQSAQANGKSFVELALGENGITFNVAAELVAPDPRKFIRTADLSMLTSKDKFTVVSGTCLFSGPGATALLADRTRVDLGDPGSLESAKSKVVDIQVDDRLQAYEADSILRLTRTMSALETNGRSIDLALNIPRVEYYLYMLDAFENGVVDPDLVIKWFGFVDERAERIEGLVRKYAPSEFTSSSLSPLEPMESKIKSRVLSGQPGLLNSLVGALSSQSIFWKYLIEKDPPKSFNDLSRLSYKVAYLMVTQGESFPIAIEDPEEAPILENLKRKLDGLSIKMLALYPHSNAVPNFEPKNGKVNNYFFPPQENQLGVLRQISRLNRQT